MLVRRGARHRRVPAPARAVRHRRVPAPVKRSSPVTTPGGGGPQLAAGARGETSGGVEEGGEAGEGCVGTICRF
ncbi:hypothetical protein HMPREF9062_0859 [Actinomyces sp. oral taxon 448 str. F0400]|nr:hypothetical protein HMPREF9062_0859 [Actinomyces sp. oral taxon 448 str. F0400]